MAVKKLLLGAVGFLMYSSFGEAFKLSIEFFLRGRRQRMRAFMFIGITTGAVLAATNQKLFETEVTIVDEQEEELEKQA